MAIFMVMTDYSVSEAKDQLPRLLDRMLAGEEVVITRRNKVIARLSPVSEPPPVRQPPVDVEWLKAARAKPERSIDSVALIRAVRDEEAS